MTALLHISAALSAMIALFLATSRAGPRAANRLLAAAFALLAVLHGLSSLAMISPGTGSAAARPALAMALPPLLYLHLRSLARPDRRLHPVDAFHLAGPAAMMGGRLVLGSGLWVDAFIVAALAGYAALTMATVRLPPGPARRWAWSVAAWMALIALADLAIALELRDGRRLEQSRALAATLVAIVGALGYVLIAGLHHSGPLRWIAARLGPRRGDADFAERLAAHVETGQCWRDPEMTVARLARRLGVPQRRVSETVNDAFEMSVSQWLNGYRVAEAQRLMRAEPDRPLVELMLDAGFQTRSNFNRAFKEVTGETPSAWRRART